jgi:predicted regulator of Ras-like GTPase activity (Roadblock/LC7/MglB family)
LGRQWAEPVAAIAGDNLLIATMAARVVASGGVSLAEASSDDVLRRMVLARFADVITGSIGEPADAPVLRSMLDLVAVTQPVHLNDRRLGELFEATTGHSAAQADRALRILVRGGVVYQRGVAYRLMPDVLGDYLIDESCVREDGTLTRFAEKVIDQVGHEQLEQVMVNLGRMDWRRNQGDPSNSVLLERAWERLDDLEYSWDPRFRAVRAVAMYQPRQALAYVQRNLGRPEIAREITPVLRNIAYADDYRRDVCRLLWEMGRDDDRALASIQPSDPNAGGAVPLR